MIEKAKRAVVEAGDVAIRVKRAGLSSRSHESETNISTEGDTLAEERILAIIKKNFPEHNIVTEETGRVDRGSKFTWIIDPIDGTLAYFSGLDTFGISVGLFKDDKPFLGAINFPALKLLFWAEKGKGSYLNGKRIRVNKETDLKKSIVGFDFGYSGRVEEAQEILIPLVDEVRYTPMFACNVFGMTSVARGVYQAYIHEALIWDFAAAVPIVEEAGGKVTNYKGGSVDWDKKWIDIVASNGLIHNEIVKLINR